MVTNSAPLYNSPPTSPDYLGFRIDQIDDYDIHTNTLALDQANWNYEAEIRFGTSIGDSSADCSENFYKDSPFELADLDLGRNFMVLLNLQSENQKV